MIMELIATARFWGFVLFCFLPEESTKIVKRSWVFSFVKWVVYEKNRNVMMQGNAEYLRLG